MIRLLGVDLPRNKKIYIALTAIYGIGYKTAFKVLEKVQINPNLKQEDLSDNNIKSLKALLESDSLKLEGDLKRIRSLNVKRLVEINCYRGKRHIKGLPSRGQRTRTNSHSSKKSRTYLSKSKK